MNKEVTSIVPKEKGIMDEAALSIFNRPIAPGEVNLIEVIASYIDHYGYEIGLHVYVNDSGIKSVALSTPPVQRIMINRYFVYQFMIYRSLTGNNVSNVLPFLANDGDTEDWLTIMREVVIPFVKENNILGTVYNYYLSLSAS